MSRITASTTAPGKGHLYRPDGPGRLPESVRGVVRFPDGSRSGWCVRLHEVLDANGQEVGVRVQMKHFTAQVRSVARSRMTIVAAVVVTCLAGLAAGWPAVKAARMEAEDQVRPAAGGPP